MRVRDIQKGDIITYKHGKVNYVNKPINYHLYFDSNFRNCEIPDLEIVKIQRYVKTLWFYKLKTIWRRK